MMCASTNEHPRSPPCATAKQASLACSVLLLGAALSGTALAQSMEFPQRFPPGEHHLFKGRYGLISLGEASMVVLHDDTVQGEPARHFRLTIRGRIPAVYSIDDQFDSWVSLRDGLSRRFVQGYDESNQDGRNEYAIWPDSGFYRQSGSASSLRTVAEPLDDTAFLYWVRTLDLAPGDTLRLERYFRPERNPVTVVVLGRDTIDVPAGRFETLVLHPVIPDGGILFSQEANSRIWISDDARRIVVQIKATLGKYFTVALVLKEYVAESGP